MKFFGTPSLLWFINICCKQHDITLIKVMTYFLFTRELIDWVTKVYICIIIVPGKLCSGDDRTVANSSHSYPINVLL